MIRYSLRCKDEHEFEGWFRSSVDYDAQAAKGLLSCPDCGSKRVEKAIMAPSVGRASESAEAAQKAHSVRQFFTKLRKHVEQHSDYVGDTFPHVARAIHYGDAEERQIYGEATLEDARELIEEGIGVLPLPPAEQHDA